MSLLTINALLQESEKARKMNSSYEYTNEMSSYDLLVIDDFGLMELDLDKCRDLFEIIETCDSRKYSAQRMPKLPNGVQEITR